MTFAVLPKKLKLKRYLMTPNMKMNQLHVIITQESLNQKEGNY